MAQQFILFGTNTFRSSAMSQCPLPHQHKLYNKGKDAFLLRKGEMICGSLLNS